MKRLRTESADLDAADMKILRLLEKDARTSTAELARSVGLSAPSVAERIKRLQESCVIEAYSVRINPAALGLPLSAWLRIRPVPGQLAVVAEIIRELPEIAQCDRVTGEDRRGARSSSCRRSGRHITVPLQRRSSEVVLCRGPVRRAWPIEACC